MVQSIVGNGRKHYRTSSSGQRHDHARHPSCIALAPGQASDKAVVAGLNEGLPSGCYLVADRGHDARAIIEQVEAIGGRAHIYNSSFPVAPCALLR